MSIIGGVIAGLLGFTGLRGFIFYFLVMAITSVGIAAKAGFYVRPYFDSWNQILLDGFLGGLLVCLFFACIKFFFSPFVIIDISEDNILYNVPYLLKSENCLFLPMI